ncbi:MAG: GNAT family N-acetyltransferase [Dokdonella sp.]
MDVNVERNEAANRFEAIVDDVLCVLEYRLDGKVITLLHTGVPDAVGGRGIAAALTKTALDTARHEGWRVVPACAYSLSYIARHPQYQDLVSDG